MSSFYEITFQDNDEAAWELVVPLANDVWTEAWCFTKGRWVDSLPQHLKLEVFSDGHPVDFNISSFHIPVISANMGRILDKLVCHEIQRIPIAVADAVGQWEILNILNAVDCIDTRRSIIDYYPASSADPAIHLNSHLIGQPRGVRKLAIDNSLVRNHQIFRLRSWPLPIIVSDEIRIAVESAKLTGCQFLNVS